MNTNRQKRENLDNRVINLTHDLRSPLLTLKEIFTRYAEIMSDRDRQAFVCATNRAQDLCDETLSQMGPIKPQPRCFVHQCLWQLVQEMNLRGVEQGQFLEFNSIVKTSSQVALSQVGLTRMVANLIENSLRAIKPCGKVQVDLKEQDQWVLISVMDNGCGMTAEQLDQLGQYGVSFSKGGHGFGLWSVQQSLQKIGGQIKIRSIEKVGTEIIIQLPLLQKEKATLDLEDCESFVLVDDDPLIHQLMDFCLDSIGYRGPRYFMKDENEFNSFMSQVDPQSLSHTRFVIDINLGQRHPVGLMLIQGYDIVQQSLLFTGDLDYQDLPELRVRSKKDSPFDFLRLHA